MSADPQGAPGAAEIAQLLEADGVLILLVDGQELSVADIWPSHPAAPSLRLQVGFGVTGLVARTGVAKLIASDSPRNALHRQLLRLEPQQTVARMCLPLRGLGDHVVGVLAAHRAPTRPFRTADADAVGSLATVLGFQLHAQQLWSTVNRHRSERDRLIKQAISAQEAERRRIAFDLHDGVTTALASMSFHISAADLTVSELGRSDPPQDVTRARAELGNARQLANLAYNQTRAAIAGLHSMVLDDLGLVAALETLIQTVSREDGPGIDLIVDPSAPLDQVPDHVTTALYRITQEALANAVKHAEATQVVITVRRFGNSIVLGCTDDGVGFDPEERRAQRAGSGEGDSPHFGMSSIAERCAMIEASLRVESWPGRGTTLLVELPALEQLR